MKMPRSRVVLLLAALAMLVILPVRGSARTASVYFVGNSVTDTLEYSGFQALAQSRGHTLPFGRHMIPGAPLDWIWANPSSGFNESPFGYYPSALGGYTWDFISLQPFDRSLAQDLASIRGYVDLAANKSPAARILVYARWPRASEAYDTRWQRASSDPQGGQESKAFFEELTASVRAAYPNREVLMVPVGHALYELNQRIKAGLVPGLSNVHDLYTDGVHLDNRGRYLVALTFFTTIFREDPRGLPVPAAYGSIAPELVPILQDTVLDVVAAHPLSGVTLQFPFEVGTSALPPAIRGLSYDFNLDANFGTAPFSWSLVAGSLPAGISLASNGKLSGTSSALGTSEIRVRVSDASVPPKQAEAALRLAVEEDTLPEINTATLPAGALGTPYRRSFPGFAATSGNGAYSWSLASGSLPPGLTLNARGRLQGAPQTQGDFTFTLRVTDSDATPDSAEKTFTVSVGPAAASTLVARRVGGEMKIDGVLDETVWRVDRPLDRVRGGVDGGRNEGAWFDALWDGAYAYFAIRVKDTERPANSQPIAGDAVHLFLDGLHDGEAVFNADDRQLVVDPFGRARELNTRGEGIIHAASALPDGYSVEIAVPWVNLSRAPTDGLSVGFDLVVADDVGGGAAEGERALGETSLTAPSPAAFRDLLFAAAQGTLAGRPGVLAEETFDYPPGVLHGRSGGRGWSGGWVVQNNNVTIPGYETRVSSPVRVTGLAASPGNASGGNAYLSSGRRFDTAASGSFSGYLANGLIGAAGTELWVAWVARRDGNGRSDMALHRGSSSAIPGDTPPIRVRAENNRWVLHAGGQSVDTGINASAGSSFLLVLRIRFGAAGDVALFVNPPPGGSPGAAVATLTGLADLSFHSLAWYPGISSGQGTLDEIRVGTRFAAVVPTVETSPFGAGVGGARGVRSGAAAFLWADVRGSNLEVEWYRNGGILTERGAVWGRSPFLRADAGDYRFKAANRLGSIWSDPVTIEALGWTLAEWRAARFGAGEADQAWSEQSPAGDGLPNLLKFTLGLDPAQREAAPAAVTTMVDAVVHPALDFSFDSSANDVVLTVEGSVDLVAWRTLAVIRATAAELAPDVALSREPWVERPGVERMRLRAPVAPRYFFRNRVSVADSAGE